MKLIQVLRLVMKLAPGGEIAEVLERVIAYMEIVERALDLVAQILPQHDGAVSPTADHPSVVELRSLLDKLEAHR
jgi:hypothetical protein